MILIIDCTTGFEFAFLKDKKIIFKKKSKKLKNISEKLVLEIERSLSQLELLYKDIKKVIVITGPGSFTGIRSAITFSKILKLSLKIEILGVSKFDILNLLTLSNKKDEEKTIFIANNKNTYFFQKFNSTGKAISSPEIVDLNTNTINIGKRVRVISDDILLKKYIDHKKTSKKPNLIEIIKYKIDDIEKLSLRLREKKHNPKPVYVKYFF